MDMRVLLAICLVGVVCCQSPEDKCGGKECPRYSVEETGEGFEVRQYEPAKWAAVTLPTNLPWRQKQQHMRKLFQYFQGGNDAGLTIEKTTPLLKKLEGEMTSPDFRKTIMLMLPTDQQAQPPAPTDADVTIVEMPAMTVFAAEMPRPAGRGNRRRGGRNKGNRRNGRGNGRTNRGERRRGARGGRDQPDAGAGAGAEETVARFRRGARGGHGGRRHAARWQQYMDSQVDALRQKLGDRTVQEDVLYMAMYGQPRSPGSVKELWLLPA